jgi:hypothetical protein
MWGGSVRGTMRFASPGTLLMSISAKRWSTALPMTGSIARAPSSRRPIPARGRRLFLLTSVVAAAVLAAAGPWLFERAGMLKRRLAHRGDGVGLGIAYAPCDPASPSTADPDTCAAEALTSQLGSHVLLWHEDGNGPGVAVTPPINTQTSGSSLIAFSAGYAGNNALPTDNKGNIWSPLGAPVVYRGYNGAFDVKAYAVFGAHGGNGHSLSIVKNAEAAGEITVPFIEIRQSAALHAIAQNYPAAAAVVTSASVNTSGAATLLALWWGDAAGLQHSAIPNNGFSIIENFVNLPPNSAVQCVVAVRQVTSAGTYSVSWTQSPSEGAVLWLLAFQTDDRVFSSSFE